jgi:FkbM family methyltransferase
MAMRIEDSTGRHSVLTLFVMLRRLIHRIRTEKYFVRWALLKLLIHSGLGRFLSFNVRGMKLRLFSSSVCYEAYRKRAAYRAQDMLVLQQILKPGDVVVDVGANAGFITLAAAQRIGPSGRIIAMEPQPKIYGFLKDHIRLNNHCNVQALNVAVGDRNGTVSFVCDRDDDRSRVDASGRISIPMLTLDEALRQEHIASVDFLKIDVEGYELFVLQGAPDTLRKTRYIYIETDLETYARSGYTIEDVLAFLRDASFELFVPNDAGNWLPATFETVGESNNVIARRKSIVTDASAKHVAI